MTASRAYPRIRALSVLLLASLLAPFTVESMSMPPPSSARLAATAVRVELFFQSPRDLAERVKFLRAQGVRSFNLVNKDRRDDLRGWIDEVRAACPDADICAHYSLKYNKVARKGIADHAEKMKEFLISNTKSPNEILLLSGSGKKVPWNTLEALGQWPDESDARVAVAYNPYFPDEDDQAMEDDRLQKKLETKKVDKIYFQFGTDLSKLKAALERLSSMSSTPEKKLLLAGSLFLPTKKLIAQQKFRPWNGVFLSPEFLQGPEPATDVILQILRLYNKYDVEPLWEAPGIRTQDDWKLAQGLMERSQILEMDDGDISADPVGATPPIKGTQEEPPEKRRKVERAKEPCILLFGSHDVRVADNGALEAACRSHQTVIPVFIWTKQGEWGVRGALEVVLKAALKSLDDSLRQHGMNLVCRETNSYSEEVLNLVKETNATAVFWNKEHTTESRKMDDELSNLLKSNDIDFCVSQSSLLYDPEAISLTKGFHGGHWGTLMPFLKNCKKSHGEPTRPTPNHETFRLLEQASGPEKWPAGISVDSLHMAMITGKQRWDEPILNRFPMSERDAHRTMKDFFRNGIRLYEKERSRTDKDHVTSKLSVHLRIGTISPNELYWATEKCGLGYDQLKTFSRRLFWRDLAYYQLCCFPEMRSKSIREHYEKTEWVTGEEAKRRLTAWKWGRTGYPIVDAGMRELYKTGFMTQSVRMVVASFLVEYLRVNWVEGCRWFHYTLADCDSAINAMMWQNAGKAGIDQWNFVLSPETASQDPSGKYTRKYVPELASLPTAELVHRPWQATREVLEQAGVILGETYPHRIVADLKQERKLSVESTLKMRRDSQYANNDRGYDVIKLPDGSNTVVFTKKEYRIDSDGKIINSSTSSGRNNPTRSKVQSKKVNRRAKRQTASSIK